MDIFSAEEAIIKAGERKNVKTGVKMELPEGYVGLVWDKSGLALKNGIKNPGRSGGFLLSRRNRNCFG